jgi:hypothetical protein
MMLYEIIGQLLITAGDAEPIDDASWDRMLLDSEESMARGPVQVLVATLGSGPGVMQRARLALRLRGQKLTAAVLTGSSLTRGVVRAFGWSGIANVQAFAPDEVTAAIEHLDLPENLRATARERLLVLQRAIAERRDPGRAALRNEAG